MKILAVDDEKLALSRLDRLLRGFGIEDIDCFQNPLDALKECSKKKYDAVFLDISMPKLNGLELASKILEIEPTTYIVFQTAFEKYALEAFKKGGMQYILKPIEEQEVKNSLKKIHDYSSSLIQNDKKLLGKRDNTIYLIDIDDIYYVKADLEEVIVRVKNDEIYVKKKIGDLYNMLKSKNFFRVHRSYIVNVDKIKSMDSVDQSKLLIKFIDIDNVVTSSKEGAKEFREFLERRTL